MAGISLQPMLTPSGALLLPALQQNAAAAVAAFAAAAAAAAAASQQQQQQQQSLPPVSSAAFSMVGSPVMMAPFQRTRLKVERESLEEYNKCDGGFVFLFDAHLLVETEIPFRLPFFLFIPYLHPFLMKRSEVVSSHESRDNVGS